MLYRNFAFIIIEYTSQIFELFKIEKLVNNLSKQKQASRKMINDNQIFFILLPCNSKIKKNSRFYKWKQKLPKIIGHNLADPRICGRPIICENKMPMVTKSCATLPREPRKLTGDISVRYIGTRPELRPEIINTM